MDADLKSRCWVKRGELEVEECSAVCGQLGGPRSGECGGSADEGQEEGVHDGKDGEMRTGI
jgi:hypothetical protein